MLSSQFEGDFQTMTLPATDDDLQQLLDGVLDDFHIDNVQEPVAVKNIDKLIDDTIKDSTEKMNDPLLDDLEEIFKDNQFAEGLEDLMQQLLTKDMLYEPLVALREKYEELDDRQYDEQSQIINQMISAFDNGQDSKIPQLIEKMQEFEMPKELADMQEGCPLQ